MIERHRWRDSVERLGGETSVERQWRGSGGKVSGERFESTTFLVVVVGLLGGAVSALLLPWAAAQGRLGGAGLVAALLFLAYCGLGLAYAWRRGGPDWDAKETPGHDGSTRR